MRRGWIKTPLKKLNRHFNFSYIFSQPDSNEKKYMEQKVANAKICQRNIAI